ncbi:MAG: cytidylate kinase-like family protein [Deltaproteobacteria bacterium]|nr:cytidylate kinase-like family protein [Deltaproteobacteria bacterium]
MPIIAFSSDSYQKSGEIAVKTAEALGYKCLDRKILRSVAAKHDIPEENLIKALDETPSFMGMSSKAWKRYLIYIQEVVLGILLDDNVVCHGLAAHLYLLGISHVLKVRLFEGREARAGIIAKQERVSREKAKKIVRRKEKQRKRWSLEAFGRDETDPSFYDMSINISQIDPGEAVSMLVTATGYRKFKPMTYSMECMRERELTGRVRVALLKDFPNAMVQARGSAVVVEIKALKREKSRKISAVKELVGNISGVHHVEVHIIKDIFREAAESGR